MTTTYNGLSLRAVGSFTKGFLKALIFIIFSPLISFTVMDWTYRDVEHHLGNYLQGFFLGPGMTSVALVSTMELFPFVDGVGDLHSHDMGVVAGISLMYWVVFIVLLVAII